MTSIFDPVTYQTDLALALEFFGIIVDGGTPYAFTGDLSLNTEAQYNALVWTDGRTKPDYDDILNANDDAQQVRAERIKLKYIYSDHTVLSAMPAFPEHASDILNDSAVTGSTIRDALNALNNKLIRTTSSLSLSLVGSGATGTQISASKDSTIYLNLSGSTTSTIGGASTSVITLKVCATNNATEGSWTTWAVFESDQTITLALALQSLQVIKGQLVADLPAGWYIKAVASGSGTHSESILSGQKTIYG